MRTVGYKNLLCLAAFVATVSHSLWEILNSVQLIRNYGLSGPWQVVICWNIFPHAINIHIPLSGNSIAVTFVECEWVTWRSNWIIHFVFKAYLVKWPTDRILHRVYECKFRYRHIRRELTYSCIWVNNKIPVCVSKIILTGKAAVCDRPTADPLPLCIVLRVDDLVNFHIVQLIRI